MAHQPALSKIELRYSALNDNNANTDPTRSVGGRMSTEVIEDDQFNRLSSNITGLVIADLYNTVLGVGQLDWNPVTHKLSWIPPNSAVTYSRYLSEGFHTLGSINGAISITVTDASLPVSFQSDTVEITSIFSGLFDNVTEEDRITGVTQYRMLWIYNNGVEDLTDGGIALTDAVSSTVTFKHAIQYSEKTSTPLVLYSKPLGILNYADPDDLLMAHRPYFKLNFWNGAQEGDIRLWYDQSYDWLELRSPNNATLALNGVSGYSEGDRTYWLVNGGGYVGYNITSNTWPVADFYEYIPVTVTDKDVFNLLPDFMTMTQADQIINSSDNSDLPVGYAHKYWIERVIAPNASLEDDVSFSLRVYATSPKHL